MMSGPSISCSLHWTLLFEVVCVENDAMDVSGVPVVGSSKISNGNPQPQSAIVRKAVEQDNNNDDDNAQRSKRSHMRIVTYARGLPKRENQCSHGHEENGNLCGCSSFCFSVLTFLLVCYE
jgi:hypothetical protein